MGYTPKIENNPVPWTNTETMEKFNMALEKSKLLYENIELNKKFQMALLSNNDKHGYGLMYTSSIDGKVYLKSLQYQDAKFTRCVKSKDTIQYRPGTIEIKGEYPENPKIGAYGLLRYDGEVILPPKFHNIDDIHQSFIKCEPAGDRLNFLVYDYDGKLRLKVDNGYPEVLRQRIRGHRVAFIIDNLEYTTKVYMIHDDKIYDFLWYAQYMSGHSIRFGYDKSGVRIGVVDKRNRYDENHTVFFNYKEMLEAAHEHVIGKQRSTKLTSKDLGF